MDAIQREIKELCDEGHKCEEEGKKRLEEGDLLGAYLKFKDASIFYKWGYGRGNPSVSKK